MSNYKVGQILYLLSAQTMKVFPVQIVEEVVRNSLKGKHVTYTIMLPDRKKSLSELDNINAEIFDDIEKLREFMTNNAKLSINHIIKNAATLSTIFGSSSKEEPSNDNKSFKIIDDSSEIKTEDSVQIDTSSGKIKVDLGNGMKANIKVEDLTDLPGFN